MASHKGPVVQLHDDVESLSEKASTPPSALESNQYSYLKDKTDSNWTERQDSYALEKTQTGSTTASSRLEPSATRDASKGADQPAPKIDRKIFLACLSLSFLWTGSQIPLYLLLASVNATLEDIGGANVQVWFVLGPLAALAAIAPVAGSLSDILGRRYSILAGGLSMVIGLVLIGSAQNVAMELISMPFTGMGASLLEVNALAAVNEIAPNKHRGFYTSVLTWTIIPFAPAGIYATMLSSYADWRWNVWIPLMWVGIGIVMSWFFYNPPPRKTVARYTRVEILKRIDWIGYALSTAGLVLFLFGLGSGGNTAPWKSATTIVPLIVGVALLCLLAFWEMHAKRPLFPLGMFKNFRVFFLTLIITAVAGAQFFTILILFPKFASAVYLPTPEKLGGMITASQFSIFFGASVFSASVSKFHGTIRPQMMLACALMAAGYGSIGAFSYTNTVGPTIMVILGGIGVGGVILPAATITQLCTPDEYIGAVTAITFVARVVGGGVGFAASYAVLNSKMTSLYNSYLTNKTSLEIVTLCLKGGLSVDQIEDFLKAVALDDLRTAREISDNDFLVKAVQVLSRPLWQIAFKEVFLVTLAFSLLGFVAAMFLGDVRKYSTGHIAMHL
ncbi:hypothetical protein PYCC9005_005781 [Savitreella phatthalungensis]